MSASTPRVDFLARLAAIVMYLAVALAAAQYVITAWTSTEPSVGPTPLRGMTFDVLEVFNSTSPSPTLVLGLSTACRFCTESMSFYRTLAARDDVRGGGLQLAVVSFQPQNEMRRYLEYHGVAVSAIVEVQDTGIPIRRTPTVLLLDREGTVIEAWTGKLTQEGEREVSAAAYLAARRSP